MLHEPGNPSSPVLSHKRGDFARPHLQAASELRRAWSAARGFGSAVALGVNNSGNQAIVQIGGTASRLSKTHFIAAYDASDDLKRSVGRYLSKALGEAQQLSACNATHDLESRLCRWLLQARDRTGQTKLPLTQEFLAQMLGVKRTTVTIGRKPPGKPPDFSEPRGCGDCCPRKDAGSGVRVLCGYVKRRLN